MVGSFIGAYTYRKQKGISILSGRSFCPHCKAKILWFDNIPLLSFLLLKGRCRACGKKISKRYPVIELGTALLFLIFTVSIVACPSGNNLNVLCTWQATFGSWAYPLVLGVISILLAIFIIDLESKIIPDEIVFFGILFVSAFYLVGRPNLIFKNFFVGFGASLFFLLVHLLTRGRGMGLGDVKFVILGGLILGWPLAAVWLFFAFSLGAVIGVVLILLKRAKFGQEIPFGPYLVVSLMLTVLFGQTILSSYLQ